MLVEQIVGAVKTSFCSTQLIMTGNSKGEGQWGLGVGSEIYFQSSYSYMLCVKYYSILGVMVVICLLIKNFLDPRYPRHYGFDPR